MGIRHVGPTVAVVVSIAILATGCAGASDRRTNDDSTSECPSITDGGNPHPTTPLPPVVTPLQPTIVTVAPDTAPIVQGYDMLWIVGINRKAPGLSDLAEQYGLNTVCDVNKAGYNQAYVGIAPLDSTCVVVFSTLGTKSSVEGITVIVMSRYDRSMAVIGFNQRQTDVKSFIDGQRPACKQLSTPTPTPIV